MEVGDAGFRWVRYAECLRCGTRCYSDAEVVLHRGDHLLADMRSNVTSSATNVVGSVTNEPPDPRVRVTRYPR